MSTAQDPPGIAPPAVDAPARVDETGVELKRGAFLNTIAMLASNFRGIFTFLVARLLGPAALGIFSVAWSTTDIISKLGIFGLDNTITTFIARSEALGERWRSRVLFRLAIALGVAQSALTAGLVVIVLQLFHNRLGLQREMVSALAVLICAMPGVALYRIATSVSRGMKVMQHDIYSRGMAEPTVTTLAFLLALVVGFKEFSPEVAAIVGTAASGLVALALASKLFRHTPGERGLGVSYLTEARKLLSYAAPISGYQLLNTLIARLDIIMLGYFVGHAPGVTLATVGIYGAVVDTANGARKVNQAFNPIFAPVVAGMTVVGDQERAAATYGRLAQWMLWILLPFVAVMALAGSTILLVFGPAFQQGGMWLGIVAVGSATSAFISLSETVILVQKPHLNLLHSCITCAVAVVLNSWLIPRFGVTGAAFGAVGPHIVQGILRSVALRLVFKWRNPWRQIAPPILAALVAIVPAFICRISLNGIVAQIASAATFLLVFGSIWGQYHWRHKTRD